ncbi:MAG: hypothetical protein R3320_11075 [Nitriliruptorales bacterium]|nr:hypothetical protein [Nitriliruptorales bacterium]
MNDWRSRLYRVWDAIDDILVRAAKTMVQTFGSIVTVDAFFDSFDTSLLMSGGLAAVAAGLSVLWNAALRWSRT